MDQLMWIVTFAALTLAVGMTMFAARVFRGDRRRSAARVAALTAAAYEPEYAQDMDPGINDINDINDEEPAYDDFRERDVGMFAAADEPKAPSRRWLALAAVAILMAAVMGTTYMLFKPAPLGASPAAQPQSAPEAQPLGAQPAATSGARSLPIELLSLKHTIDGSTFTLAGLVQNPIDGAPFTHVMAVVYLFDGDGAYFATGRADLEFRGLRPGEESPFIVKVPNIGRVGRYRVGFRRDDGSVIAHVDKRGQPAAGLMTEGKN